MPATKKVVNPEKELRGKKPYNRSGPGGAKKSYQAKPKKLDDGEVPDGAAALKKKLRDTLRLLSKNPKMPADIRLEHERRIEALKLQIAEKQVDQTEQKMVTKYRMIKFFESKKADRKIKVFERQHPNWESNDEERKELDSLKLDFAYIQHFPKTQKYISLYPTENADDPAVTKARAEIREKIKAGLESGEITQFVKAVREEVKAKIISKDTLSTEEAIRLTADKINNSKKRSRDEQDPLSGRAKATAEREKTNPKQSDAVEEEMFFEAVPKVVAASEAKAKKAKADKKQPKADAQPKKEQPKKDQSKKEQPKKEQSKETVKKNGAANAAGSSKNSADAQPTEEGEVKKLGKWARKAIRAQSTFTAQEVETSGSAPSTSTTAPEEATKDTTATETASTAATQDALAESPSTTTPATNSEKKQKKAPAKKESTPAEKQEQAQPAKSKVEEAKKTQGDAPKITTLKVDRNDRGDSDSGDSGDDEPEVPVRKIVKIDESLLKELPEVPKRRGGRNQNKFKK
ncbi:18S rRNA maturation protein [Dissophora globulifera]|uniref:rRNA-processing protein EFG1 n=1 Tax=Dissophora globulifera TaxID=979702 RepID=A0A9P6UWK1_9FUNG|nr:18S rRNA maturation protein [Dissophora globulifera]